MPHVPSVLVRSTHCRHHRNWLSLIYITGEESALSDSPCAHTRWPKLWQGLNHTPHVPHARLVTCWRHPCHISIHVTTTLASTSALADIISLHHLADVIIGVDHWLWLRLLIVDCWLFLIVDFLQFRCSLPNFSRRFHFCSPFLDILLLNEE